MGLDYLGPVLDGDIKENDVVLMVSLDGAQLYEHKESDCWMYIWVVLNLSPQKRYKKRAIRPGGFIPGPKKPKNIDSFLFVGMHHLSVLQKEGLLIWNVEHDAVFRSHPYLLYPTADGPGLVYWDGMVGHSGKNSCCIYCGILGRCKTNGKHYYPALIMLRDRIAVGSNHANINVFDLPSGGSSTYANNLKQLISSLNQTQYEQHKTATGITKPPLILGLSRSSLLGIPYCLTTDIMHLAGNLSSLLLSLWHSSLECDPADTCDSWDWVIFADGPTWDRYGESVHKAGAYLPGSFGTRSRNIAEKLNSGFQLHTFGLGPILLYDLLPAICFTNYCKLICGFQIMSQHSITLQSLVDAQTLLSQWESEFEAIYYQYKESRIHFIRPCVHQVNHLATETLHKGPPICYAQWTMERTIGNLKQEIRQPSNPFINLSREGVCRCRVNSLISLMPELNSSPNLIPDGAIDIGDGYILLCKCDRYFFTPPPEDIHALQVFLGCDDDVTHLKRWARL